MRTKIMVMTRRWTAFVICLLMLVVLQGCGGLRYSETSPDAKDFHPKTIGVLPVDAGTYGEAKGIADQVITGVLADTKWFTDVISTNAISSLIATDQEARKNITDYLAKLKMLNYSDPELSRKIGDAIKADAFLVVNVDYWQYTKESDKKVAKTGFGMKLVDAYTGNIVWKAGHYESESYTLFKPEIPNAARSLARKMISEMPH